MPSRQNALAPKVDSLPAFDPLDRVTLQSQAYLQLRKAVMGGVFKPGTVITIRAAAEALGTSPMPVRAALQRLETEGALVARGSKRTLEIPALTAEEYNELRDIRIAMEGLAAERAVANITAEELETVERNCEAMQAAAEAGDLEAYVRSNWDFHLSIYRSSHMETLVGMIEGLWLRVGPYVRFMMPDRDSLVASMPDHWNMLEAIKRRDHEAARRAIADDIGHSAVNLVKMLQHR
jgi:DNA-binding GntR family transcriptional regulator